MWGFGKYMIIEKRLLSSILCRTKYFTMHIMLNNDDMRKIIFFLKFTINEPMQYCYKMGEINNA